MGEREKPSMCVPFSLPCAVFPAGAPLSHGCSSLLLVTPWYHSGSQQEADHTSEKNDLR